MNGDQEIEYLCDRLQLSFESQDWGIVNATPQRLSEFMSFYSCERLSRTQQIYMMELIIASANEAIIEQEMTSDSSSDFCRR